MSDTLWAGSTTSVAYFPADTTGATYTAEPTLDSVVLSDAAGTPVTLASSATWMQNPDGGTSDRYGWVLNIGPTEAPVSADGQTWTLDWAWTDTTGAAKTQRFTYAVALEVGDSLSAPALTVGTNTYVTDDEADTYFSERLYCSTWTATSGDDRARALIMATRAIDLLMLKGVRSATTQTLEFPRCYFVQQAPPWAGMPPWPQQPHGYLETRPGWACETATPAAVKSAVCEEALALLDGSGMQRRALQAQGVVSFSLGSLSETYGNRTQLLSEAAMRLMRPYMAGSAPIV